MNYLKLPIPIAITLSIVLFLSGCGLFSSKHDHLDAFGIVLKADGEVIAKQENGQITYTHGNSIALLHGGQTPAISVEFFDDNGDLFVPDDPDYFLGWNINQQDNVISITSIDAWSFRIMGNSEGNATVAFEMVHVDHADFTSMPFNVTVTMPTENQ